MVAAYFKNIAQTRTLIELIHDRAEIQTQALQQMKEKFAYYNLELEEVLIGTPKSSQGDPQIENILMQLRSRQIAREQIETYIRQQEAAVQERELREAQARAEQQSSVTASEMSIAVQSNEGKAEYQRAVQQAAQVRTLAEAEAEKVTRLGVAQALAVEEQVRAYNGPQFMVTQQVLNRFAEAIQQTGIEVVPRVLISGNNGNNGNGSALGGNSLMEGLLALLLSERMGVAVTEPTADLPRSPAAELLRTQMQERLAQPPGA